ncbi:MAG TPA: CoA ester lyase [Microthrixaceae bacterium]|nr:CoA ester lyase [Microthrixaceae bacterium]
MTSAEITRWRSLLFVPGNRPDLAAKAPRSGPDVVVLDLEDAVPVDGKPAARDTVREAAEALAGVVPVCVRVNPPGTSWFDDDVASLPTDLVGVVVPKLDARDQLARVADALGGRPVVAGIETVRGVLDARDVLRPPVVACYFGAEDYIADLGGVRTRRNAEVAHARAHVAMVARVAGIPALDMVTIDFRDDERFAEEAREARALGYAGKLCIHPAQVGLVHEAFHPTPDEVEWARGVLDAFDAAGGRTIAFEGQMVDEVVAARARAILAAADDT